MLNAQRLQRLLSLCPGKIGLCQELVDKGKCDWNCCKYSDSYILLLPGEYEAAKSLDFDVDMLEVLNGDFHGGMKVVPHHKGCCLDAGPGRHPYKPIDCRVFPYWFEIDDKWDVYVTTGGGCPISKNTFAIPRHLETSVVVFADLVEDMDILRFIKTSSMVNYQRVRQIGRFDLSGTTPAFVRW